MYVIKIINIKLILFLYINKHMYEQSNKINHLIKKLTKLYYGFLSILRLMNSDRTIQSISGIKRD